MSGTCVNRDVAENIFVADPQETEQLVKSAKSIFKVPLTVRAEEGLILRGSNKKQIFYSPHSSSPTRKILEQCTTLAATGVPEIPPHSFRSSGAEYPVVWAKVSQNEYRLAELIPSPPEPSSRVTLIFCGTKREVQVRKHETFPCKHSIGDIVLVPGGRYGIVCQIFCASKSFEILPVEQEHEIEHISASSLALLQEPHKTVTCSARQIYLNNLLMKKRQGILLFASLSFIVTWGEEPSKSQRKWVEFVIRSNGGTLICMKDCQLVGTKFDSRKTVLLAECPKRTVKFIYAICQDIPRLSTDWLVECQKIGELLPYSKFLLPNSSLPSTLPPPKLKKKLFARQPFRIRGSHSFKFIWQTIIQTLGGSVTFKISSIQLSQASTQLIPATPDAVVIDESQRASGSAFQTLLQCIIDQSNHFLPGS